jgi:hypothetical protein
MPWKEHANKAPPETHTNVMHDNAIALITHPFRKAAAAAPERAA